MIEYAIFLMVVAAFICLLRVARGPTASDRVLASDTINSIVIAIIVSFSVYYKNPMFADVAIVYAMISFLSTLAVSKYLMNKRKWKE